MLLNPVSSDDFPANMIQRNIISFHRKSSKPILRPIGCKNVLTDEFDSSNQENDIESLQALPNRTDIIFAFIKVNRAPLRTG